MKKSAHNGADGLALENVFNRAADNNINEKIRLLEQERQILLDLGNDLTNVREKTDLINLFSSRMKSMFHFSHVIITLIDRVQENFAPYLIDSASVEVKLHPEFSAYLSRKYPLNLPLMQQIIKSDGPVSFILDEVKDNPGSPGIIKMYYEGGIREALIAPLRSKDTVIGCVHIYAEDTVTFTSQFKRVLRSIAPQISSAITNILKNDALHRAESITGALLSLSNDIVRVKTIPELVDLTVCGLKDVFPFSHGMLALPDEDEENYVSYVMGGCDGNIQENNISLYPPAPMNDGICDAVPPDNTPLVLDMQQFDIDHAPEWFRAQYAAGARELLIKKLVGNGQNVYSLMLFANETGTFKAGAISVVQRFSNQLFTAVSNVIAHEEILKREQEKSFLLDFSSDIAAVRSHEDLFHAVRKSFVNIKGLNGYVVRKINDDRQTTSTYIYDGVVARDDDPFFQEIEKIKFPIDDKVQGRVLNSEIPLLFSVEAEMNRPDRPKYVEYWKSIKLRTVCGIALRNGDVKLGVLWLGGIEEISMPLLQGICAQVSIAMSNIIANEEVLKREREQALLLKFSRDIAAVRTKDDLQQAISSVLQDVLYIRLSVIRIIDDDGVTLSPYIFDEQLYGENMKQFKELASKEININEELSARVLASDEAVIFDIHAELEKGSKSIYVPFWKNMLENSRYTYSYGAPLRVGDTTLGIMWLLTNEINETVLRGIRAQIAIAVSNIRAHEKLLTYKRKLEIENDYMKEQIGSMYNFSEIVGDGAAMQKVYRLMSQVAESSSSVLVLGETGTGKELIARAIHNASPRKNKLMVKVNCAALPANLIESELFGHEKGAFTGAIDRRIGKFELANNSTLFLDEIGEMPLELQVKLLRALQEKEIERVGGKTTIKVDVRIIAATNRDLAAEVLSGKFRSDLYYRLNVFPIQLPPLRERPEDIIPLTEFFIAKFNKKTGKRVNGMTPRVVQMLKSYPWPGNVREMEHLIERSILLCNDDLLREIYLPKPDSNSENIESNIFAIRPLEDMERLYIIEALKRCGGRVSGDGGAAELLQLPGTTLHSKMKKLGIKKADYYLR